MIKIMRCNTLAIRLRKQDELYFRGLRVKPTMAAFFVVLQLIADEIFESLNF
jgi:hypothetical protein